MCDERLAVSVRRAMCMRAMLHSQCRGQHRCVRALTPIRCVVSARITGQLTVWRLARDLSAHLSTRTRTPASHPLWSASALRFLPTRVLVPFTTTPSTVASRSNVIVPATGFCVALPSLVPCVRARSTKYSSTRCQSRSAVGRVRFAPVSTTPTRTHSHTHKTQTNTHTLRYIAQGKPHGAVV